ncbi:hypothetical protein GCM10023320_23890 [Pseudonocardia adelaidensis]|uniref:Uncharacterized protein n=1 Tax=Pseudonocardia adelaidensis TaxID=648754 RepID=A0ABP9NGF8_9PSEU
MASEAQPAPPRTQHRGGTGQAASEPWEVPNGSRSGLVSAEVAARYAQAFSADPAGDDGLDIGLNAEIRSEPGARVSMRVEAFSDEQDALELVLETAQHITWWKSLSYFVAVQGSRGLGPELRIETRDRVHRASQLLYLPDLTRYGVIELWKGGFLNFGAFIGSLPINSFANRGRSIVFRWEED